MRDDLWWIDNFASSNVERFAYDYDESIQYVQFHNGSIYGYDVGPEVFEAMDRAVSKGQFVWQHLRGHEV